MMKYDCPNSQNAKNSAIVYSRFVPSMYQRGNFTPAKMATEIARTTASKKMPRNALGKPRIRACHVCATAEHDKTDEISQPKRADELESSCHASI